MGLKEFDDEGRVLVVDFDKVSIISAYFPNSQDGGARLDYKLDFCAAILEFCDSIHCSSRARGPWPTTGPQ